MTTLTSHALSTLRISLSPKDLALAFLAWVVEKDRAYRESQHIKSLSPEALKDTGYTG